MSNSEIKADDPSDKGSGFALTESLESRKTREASTLIALMNLRLRERGYERLDIKVYYRMEYGTFVKYCVESKPASSFSYFLKGILKEVICVNLINSIEKTALCYQIPEMLGMLNAILNDGEISFNTSLSDMKDEVIIQTFLNDERFDIPHRCKTWDLQKEIIRIVVSNSISKFINDNFYEPETADQKGNKESSSKEADSWGKCFERASILQALLRERDEQASVLMGFKDQHAVSIIKFKSLIYEVTGPLDNPFDTQKRAIANFFNYIIADRNENLCYDCVNIFEELFTRGISFTFNVIKENKASISVSLGSDIHLQSSETTIRQAATTIAGLLTEEWIKMVDDLTIEYKGKKK